jgi:hypothetical protein
MVASPSSPQQSSPGQEQNTDQAQVVFQRNPTVIRLSSAMGVIGYRFAACSSLVAAVVANLLVTLSHLAVVSVDSARLARQSAGDPEATGPRMRWPMRRWLAAAAVLGLMAAAVAPARADMILSFNAEGTFSDGATLSGTVTIDVTTGVATAVDLVVGAPDSLTFTTITFQAANSPVSGDYSIIAETSNSILFDIYLPTATLVGYDGGPFESNSQAVNGLPSIIVYRGDVNVALEEGSLSPSAISTPAPSTLVLALIGAFTAAAAGTTSLRRTNERHRCVLLSIVWGVGGMIVQVASASFNVGRTQ